MTGRGELHLAILIEEMRREGLELCVSRPEVITHRDAKGNLLEPMEQLIIDVPEEYQGTVIEELSLRKGELVGVEATGTGLVRLEFKISTRGLIGYRNDFLTETRGLGVMSSRFTGYGPWKGDLPGRERGSLVSQTGGEAAGYSLENLQQRAVALRRQHDPGLRGHDRRRELTQRRHALQPHQAQATRQLPVVRRRTSTRASRSRARSPSRARWSGSPTTSSSRSRPRSCACASTSSAPSSARSSRSAARRPDVSAAAQARCRARQPWLGAATWSPPTSVIVTSWPAGQHGLPPSARVRLRRAESSPISPGAARPRRLAGAHAVPSATPRAS